MNKTSLTLTPKLIFVSTCFSLRIFPLMQRTEIKTSSELLAYEINMQGDSTGVVRMVYHGVGKNT